LTGYNFFYHNPALGFLFSSQRSLSLLRQLLYSSKSRIACQHFFEVFLLLVFAAPSEAAYL